MVCELKIMAGSTKNCIAKKSMVIRHSVKELLAKNRVTRPMKYIADQISMLFSDITQKHQF